MNNELVEILIKEVRAYNELLGDFERITGCDRSEFIDKVLDMRRSDSDLNQFKDRLNSFYFDENKTAELDGNSPSSVSGELEYFAYLDRLYSRNKILGLLLTTTGSTEYTIVSDVNKAIACDATLGRIADTLDCAKYHVESRVEKLKSDCDFFENRARIAGNSESEKTALLDSIAKELGCSIDDIVNEVISLKASKDAHELIINDLREAQRSLESRLRDANSSLIGVKKTVSDICKELNCDEDKYLDVIRELKSFVEVFKEKDETQYKARDLSSKIKNLVNCDKDGVIDTVNSELSGDTEKSSKSEPSRVRVARFSAEDWSNDEELDLGYSLGFERDIDGSIYEDALETLTPKDVETMYYGSGHNEKQEEILKALEIIDSVTKVDKIGGIIRSCKQKGILANEYKKKVRQGIRKGRAKLESLKNERLQKLNSDRADIEKQIDFMVINNEDVEKIKELNEKSINLQSEYMSDIADMEAECLIAIKKYVVKLYCD